MQNILKAKYKGIDDKIGSRIEARRKILVEELLFIHGIDYPCNYEVSSTLTKVD